MKGKRLSPPLLSHHAGLDPQIPSGCILSCILLQQLEKKHSMILLYFPFPSSLFYSILFLFLFFLYPTLSQPLHSILPIYAAVLGGRSPCLHAHHTSIVHLNQTPSLRKHFPPGQASNRHKGGAEVPAAFGCSTESLLTQPHQPTPPLGLNTVCQTPRLKCPRDTRASASVRERKMKQLLQEMFSQARGKNGRK